jgi:hypothetical protein
MDWRKSSFSGANGGACLETASDDGVILVRDTAKRDGITLSVPADAWQAFTASLRLTHPGPPTEGTEPRRPCLPQSANGCVRKDSVIPPSPDRRRAGVAA